MGAATALAVGGGASLLGSVISSQAAGQAASANLAEQKRFRELEMSQEARGRADIARREGKIMDLAEASPEEIQQLQNTIQTNERDIARNEQLLNSVDPALIAAGEQLEKMILGQESKTLAPLRNQRERQRQTMEDTLRARLGSGFETSSAGIEAMSAFDRETDALMAQEQDRSIQTLLGSAQYSRQLADISPNIAASGTLAGLIAAPQQRAISGLASTPATYSKNFTPISDAGAPFVGQAMLGQGISNLGNLGLMAGMMGGGGSSASTAAPLGGMSNLEAGNMFNVGY